jgi:RNA polymerase sigma-70 factor (ECF subfamily)
LSQRDTKKEFESLVLPLLDFLMGLAMQLTQNRMRAEDLVQEAVLKAYRSFSTFRQGSNFRAWVARILTNTFVTDQDKAKRLVYGVDVDAVLDPVSKRPAQPAQPVRRLEDIPREEFSDEVVRALHELPVGTALAVYLADVEELSYAEIGEVLDVPLGTVRSRVARGRRHLQERLMDRASQMGLVTRKRS